MKKKTSNSSKSEINIQRIAKLANIPISTSEEDLFNEQLKEIIDYIDQIEKGANTSKVEPVFNVSPNFNVLRPDVTQSSLKQEEALANSVSIKDGYFVTKGVFENE